MALLYRRTLASVGLNGGMQLIVSNKRIVHSYFLVKQ
jgi:hypothetical protein